MRLRCHGSFVFQSPTDIDTELAAANDKRLLEIFRAKTAVLKQKHKESKEAARIVIETGRQESFKDMADQKEKRLQDALQRAASAHKSATAELDELKANRKDAKQEAKKARKKVDQFLKDKEDEAKRLDAETTNAQAALTAAGPEIAKLRRPLAEACADEDLSPKPGGCDKLKRDKDSAETAIKNVAVAEADARRLCAGGPLPLSPFTRDACGHQRIHRPLDRFAPSGRGTPPALDRAKRSVGARPARQAAGLCAHRGD